jgi:hypothetical protein
MRIVAFALACVLIGGVATGVRAASLTPRPALVKDGTITNVTKLPGWPGDLPSELYAGFVTVPDPALPPNTTMKMHYLFYGKEGGDDGESPVIVWYSGGPGAPSCWGTFTENGPWLLNERSFITNYDPATGTPGLIANPFAWTKLGPLLAFDNPPPTGFSDCSPPGPTGTGYACGTWNDTRVGYVNAYAIGEVLANQFPGLLDNPNRPVYIIGESYGGVYITETVHAIASATGVDSLVRVGAHIAGVGLGDACMGTDQICGNTAEAGPGRWLEWMYGHGQYPKEMFVEMQQLCTEQELRWGVVSSECDAIVRRLPQQRVRRRWPEPTALAPHAFATEIAARLQRQGACASVATAAASSTCGTNGGQPSGPHERLLVPRLGLLAVHEPELRALSHRRPS